MGETRRRYDEEFKRNAVELSYRNGKTVSHVAKDLGISKSVLVGGGKSTRNMVTGPFPVKGGSGVAPIWKNRRLKKELTDTLEERDILKKAMAIFSRRPK